jgi:hypothetical protein
MAEKKYKLQGSGFVPGLREELSKSEAEALGVLELLEECISAGLYKEVKPPAKKKEA